MLRRKIRYRILRLIISSLCLVIVAAAAGGARDAFAHLTTLARSQIGGADSAGSKDILKVEGSFSGDRWAADGKSGIKITNATNSTIWVYFNVTGSLKGAVKHISPVGLTAGETYEVPLEIADVGDLGLLGWQNQNKTFSGEITAHVLNNFSSYRLGNVQFTAGQIAKLPSVPKATAQELSGIRCIKDIISLITEKNSVMQQVYQLETINSQLEKINDSLRSQVTALQGSLQLVNSQLTQISNSQKDNSGPGGNPGGANTPPATGSGNAAPGKTTGGTSGETAQTQK